MHGSRYALSAVFGPDGRAIGEPLIDDEGIVYADIDLNDLITPKLMHDITGHYNQFGVLSLNLNRTRQRPLTVSEARVQTESKEIGELSAGLSSFQSLC